MVISLPSSTVTCSGQIGCHRLITFGIDKIGTSHLSTTLVRLFVMVNNDQMATKETPIELSFVHVTQGCLFLDQPLPGIAACAVNMVGGLTDLEFRMKEQPSRLRQQESGTCLRLLV